MALYISWGGTLAGAVAPQKLYAARTAGGIEVRAPVENRPADERMTPVTFGGMLGWFHHPPARARNVGVVLVPPVGRDWRCSYRPLQALANHLASEGIVTLRYDHLGTGDSLGLSDPAADAVPVWLDGIDRAVAELRDHAGVAEVVLIGLRIGATLAMARPRDIDGAVLLAPVLSGRSWLQQLRFSNGNGLGRTADWDEGLDTELQLSTATLAGIERMKLKSAPGAGPILIAAQNKLIANFAAQLAASRTGVEAIDFPGFNQLFLEPEFSLAPIEVIDRVRRWLDAEFGLALGGQAGWRAPPPAVLKAHGVIERVVTFGPGLRGMLCEPEVGRGENCAALICGSGCDPRAGPGGFSAYAARGLASAGVASLRFDFGGIGDSDPPSGGRPVHPYETPREQDLEAAIRVLAANGYETVSTVGICSGAYHAIRAAWRFPAVLRAFAINPIKITWNPRDSIDFSWGVGEFSHPTSHYAKALLSPKAWREAWRRKLRLSTAVAVFSDRLRSRIKGLIERRLARSPLNQMKQFLSRGGRVFFLMGERDGSREEIETHFGREAALLSGGRNAMLVVNPIIDHAMLHQRSRQLVLDELTQWLVHKPRPTCSDDPGAMPQ
jgi:pimeloyl-ACP methyl ester carboxylesterase